MQHVVFLTVKNIIMLQIINIKNKNAYHITEFYPTKSGVSIFHAHFFSMSSTTNYPISMLSFTSLISFTCWL